MALLQQISRLHDEIEELRAVYLKASEEIATLKDTKRQVKHRLKEASDELEGLKSTSTAHDPSPVDQPTSSSNRKLMKADKKTTIAELEHQLSLLEAGLARLEKKKGRVFGKREDLKARMVRKVVELQCGKEGRAILVTGAGDVAAVGNIVEWIPVEPRACRVSGMVTGREVEEIREEVARLNLKVDFPE